MGIISSFKFMYAVNKKVAIGLVLQLIGGISLGASAITNYQDFNIPDLVLANMAFIGFMFIVVGFALLYKGLKAFKKRK